MDDFESEDNLPDEAPSEKTIPDKAPPEGCDLDTLRGFARKQALRAARSWLGQGEA